MLFRIKYDAYYIDKINGNRYLQKGITGKVDIQFLDKLFNNPDVVFIEILEVINEDR